MERIPLNWITEIPLVTRIWTGSVIVVSLLVDTNLVSQYDIVYNQDLVFRKNQYWRLFTSFSYFGTFDINLLLLLYYITQYSSRLEETYHQTRDYVWMFFLNCLLIIAYTSVVGKKNMRLFGNFLVESLIYIWSKKNPELMVRFLGVIDLKASYLPMLSFLLSMTKANFDLKNEVTGFLVGHVVYYLSDVFPRVNNGVCIVSPPWNLFNRDLIGDENDNRIQIDVNDVNDAMN